MTSDRSSDVLHRLDQINDRLDRLERRLSVAGLLRRDAGAGSEVVSGGASASGVSGVSGGDGAGASGQRAAPASPAPPPVMRASAPAGAAHSMTAGEAARALARSQAKEKRGEHAPAPSRPEKSESFHSLRAASAAAPSGSVGVRPRPAPASKPRKERVDIEREIGGRWFAIGGALIVVIGAGLFLKLAYDQGWIGSIDPVVRCVMTAIFGAALVLTGELTRKRFGAFAAAGLGAAGLGMMYASAFASYGLFQLVNAPTAFTLLAACSAVGVGMAMRWKLASVAIVSLCGAYLTPILLAGDTVSPFVLPIYLFALYAGAAWISGWMGGHFSWARTLAWWATAIMGAVWVFGNGQEHPLMAFALLTGVWICAHGAALLNARREDREAPAPRESDPAFARRTAMRERVRFWGGSMMTSVATTTWSVALGVWVARISGEVDAWMVPGAWFSMTALGALMLCGGMRALTDRPRNLLEAVGANFATQAGALLALTIALGFTGWMNAAVWLALGVSAVAAARWIGSAGLRAYGVIVLGFGTFQLLTLQWWRSAGGQDLSGLYVTQWMGLAVVGGLAWLVSAWLTLDPPEVDADEAWPDSRRRIARAAPIVCAVIGSLLVFFGVVHIDSTMAATCASWLGVAVLLWFGHELQRRLELRWMATGALTACAGLWLLAYTPGWSTHDAPAFMHPGLILGLLIPMAAVFFARRWRAPVVADGPAADRAPGWGLLSAAGSMVFVATTLEAGRAAMVLTADETTRQAAISSWWGLFGVGLVALGFVRGLPAARYAGLGLMALAAGKALVVDMAGVSAAWRVVSVIGLGALMLAVATAYSRLVQRSSASGDVEKPREKPGESRGSSPGGVMTENPLIEGCSQGRFKH